MKDIALLQNGVHHAFDSREFQSLLIGVENSQMYKCQQLQVIVLYRPTRGHHIFDQLLYIRSTFIYITGYKVSIDIEFCVNLVYNGSINLKF